MADKPATTVNPQITDAITTTSVEVIGEAPALAMGTLFQAQAQAMSLMMQNAATSQQALQQINVAAVSTAVAQILSLSPGGKN